MAFMIPHSRPTIGDEEIRAVEAVLRSGQIAQGKKVEEFERHFCEHTGRRYAVATSSGTAALQLSLLALGIKKGDEVILPSYTCAALLHALDFAGAKAVLADIDPEDFNLSLSEVRKKARRKTKAVLVPHLFGRAARISEIARLGIPVLEDGTQALGASEGGRKVGNFGEVSLFSFYATKMIATGEGGMVLTDSRRTLEKLLDMRDYDKKSSYRFRTNSKMTDLEAALGIEQLKKLFAFIERRREIARRYHRAFMKEAGWKVPVESAERPHVYFRYVARPPEPAKLWLKRFLSQGIDAKGPVFKPAHRYLGLPDRDFPGTAQAMQEAVSIPIYPSLTDSECRQICESVSRVEV